MTIATLADHLTAAGYNLSYVQFVDASLPLDIATDRTDAKLWEMVDGAITCTCTGTLADVNAACVASDRKLATAILQTRGETLRGVQRAAQLLRAMRLRSAAAAPAPAPTESEQQQQQLPVDALVVISADVAGANKETVAAAVATGLPIAGTGGTSIGQIMVRQYTPRRCVPLIARVRVRVQLLSVVLRSSTSAALSRLG